MKFKHHIISKLIRGGFVFLSIWMVNTGCTKDEPEEISDGQIILNDELNLPPTPYGYSTFDLHPVLKTSFEAAQDNTPEDNPVTDWGATLGRVLFYDKMLSKNNTIACASCHHQKLGFADTARFSKGFLGGVTNRHSMGLANARYYASGHFFWDERAEALEDQVLMPIQDAVEMGMTLDEVKSRLREKAHYLLLFENAFGDPEITDDRISKALAQFVRSIISTDSKFDQGLIASNGDPMPPFSNFSMSENRGKQLFFTFGPVHCAGCHITSALVADNPRNNGTYDGDLGVYEHDPRPMNKGAFKVPSLKNVALRAPYMHKGNFKSLIEVVEHYNSGLENVDDMLDTHLRDADGKGARMNLTEQDKQALVDFLHTLTDETMIAEQAYSNPFKAQ